MYLLLNLKTRKPIAVTHNGIPNIYVTFNEAIAAAKNYNIQHVQEVNILIIGGNNVGVVDSRNNYYDINTKEDLDKLFSLITYTRTVTPKLIEIALSIKDTN